MTPQLFAYVLIFMVALFVLAWRIMPPGILTHTVNAIAGLFYGSSVVLGIMAGFNWHQVMTPTYAALTGLLFSVLASIARERGRLKGE